MKPVKPMLLPPDWKAAIRKNVVGFICSPVRLDMGIRMDEFIVKNSYLSPEQLMWFDYKGQRYVHSSAWTAREDEHPLSVELYLEADKLIHERFLFDKEEYPILEAAAGKVLNSALCPADVSKLFPESLHVACMYYYDPRIVVPRGLTNDQLKRARERVNDAITLLTARMVKNMFL